MKLRCFSKRVRVFSYFHFWLKASTYNSVCLSHYMFSLAFVCFILVFYVKSKRKSPHPLKSTCKWYKCSNSEAQEIEKTSLRRPLSPLFSFKFCPTMLCLGSCTLLFSGALFFFFLYCFRLQLKPILLLD